MTFKQFKELNRGNDLKKALGGFGRALNTAWQRFMIENPDMDPRTARAMRDLHQSVAWLYSNMGKKKLDKEETVRFDLCVRTLQNAGHILNDPAGGQKVRDYLAQPGEDTKELKGHLSTLNKKFGIDFSNEAQPYTDPKGYRYYKDMMDEEGERWIEKQNDYIRLSRLISNASKKIEFSDADEEKEFNEVLAAMIVLGINKQVRKRIKDKNGNEALVDVKDEAQALEILNGKKLDAFLSKKYGNSQKTVMELIREELKTAVREDPEEAEKNYGGLVEDLNRGVRTVLEYHADPDAGYNETKSGAEWIEEIKKTDEIYGFDPRNALVGEGGEGEGYAYNVNMMSHILAARDLSNAKAGSRKELDNRMISSRELDKKAEEMMQEYGTNYPNAILPDSINEQLTAFPTTFFVNKEGIVLGVPIIGAYVDRYESTLDSYLNAEDAAPEEEVPTEEAVPAVNGTAYNVYVMDEEGPVEGVAIQFCDDSTCSIGKTDADGLASFEMPAGTEYEVHVLTVPEEYQEDANVYHTLAEYSDVTIHLQKK